MIPASQPLTLHGQALFERNVGRALVAGAAAGALLEVLGAPRSPALLGLAALAGAALAAIRVTGWGALRQAALALGVPALALALPAADGWRMALASAAVGALWVRWSAPGPAAEPGALRGGWLNVALGALGTAALGVAGAQVAWTLGAWLEATAAPALLVALATGASCALFLALGQVPAHLALTADPVLARGETVLATLGGDLRAMVLRALRLYGECGRSLAQLPREPAREELGRTLGRVTSESIEVASEWSAVEGVLQVQVRRELGEQLLDLEQTLAESTDEVARQQLQTALAALREEEARLDELGLRRQRVIARLKAQLALLEQARLSLLGMQVGNAQLHAAELSALATRIEALSRRTHGDADLADALATSTQLEALAPHSLRALR